MRLADEQVDILLRPIDGRVVKNDPGGHAYVEQDHIRGMLTRLFGYAGWSLRQLHEPKLLFERERQLSSGKDGISVGYLCSVAIVIHTPEGDAEYQGVATGTSTMGVTAIGDAHDSALKTADSGALKRAAINLGDQFGLSLYKDGTTLAVIKKVWDGETFRVLDREPADAPV